MSDYPLSDLRVVELATGISGGYAGKLLADAGADVVKVEPPEGDPLRRWTASRTRLAPGEEGALFGFLNTTKRSVVADLAHDEGKAEVRRLAAAADVVLENGGPGWAESAGLGAEELAALNPAVSLVSISPFGSGGPWDDRPATEFTLQAEAGGIALRGRPERPPVAIGGRLGDYLVATYAAVAAVSAWHSSRVSGRGRRVDVSQLETLVLCAAPYQTIYAQFDPGSAMPQSIEVPSIEPASDGWVGFCTMTAQQWQDFAAMVEHPEWVDDKGLAMVQARSDRHGDLAEGIHRWTRAHTVEEILELAGLFRVPAAPIGNGETVTTFDHLVERGVFVENHAGFTQPRVPYLLGEGEPRPFAPAPELGAHTAQVHGGPFTSAGANGPLVEGSAADEPLRGLRVVDLTAFWAGPYAAGYLVQMGAEVVKVESIHRPDLMRLASGLRRDQLWEWSPVFHGANAGKWDVTLDLSRLSGLDLVKRLIEGADVVIENSAPRVLENFGLDWPTVHGLNERVVMVRMPAFGLDGPWRERTGFAMTIEQASGLAWRTGYADDVPIVPRGACDPLAAMHTVLALFAALEMRNRTGRGQLVEVPLLEAGLCAAAEQVIEMSAYGQLLGRIGNRSEAAAPQGLYPSEDGSWVAISVETDGQWRALVGALGEPAWATDPSLVSHDGRTDRHDEIDEELGAWTAAQTATDAVATLVDHGVPAGSAVNPREVIDNPQLVARGFLQWRSHPVTGDTGYPSFPARFDGTFPRIPAAAPTLGQHNHEVLAGILGLDDDEIAQLREEQVVGERPSFM